MTTTQIPVFDGHNDLLLRLHEAGDHSGQSFFVRNESGHIDLPRAREGGFVGGFCAIFIPDIRSDEDPEPSLTRTANGYDMALSAPIEMGYGQRSAFAMAAILFRIEAASGGEVKVVRTIDDLTSAIDAGKIATILHFEGAEAIDPGLNSLEVFYHAGLRSLGIVWSRPNAFGHGVPFRLPHSPDTGPGLTDAGKELVRACNRLGIMIDLSHINERGFCDVADISDAPLVATHSNVHALCPSTRNLTDEQLSIIRQSNGVVGLNFANCFLREDGLEHDDTPIQLMVRHIDYLVDRLGIDGVAFGSDFDGVGIPKEIGDVAGLPKLISALSERGYDTESLRKLAYQNWVNLLRRTWKDPVVDLQMATSN